MSHLVRLENITLQMVVERFCTEKVLKRVDERVSEESEKTVDESKEL